MKKESRAVTVSSPGKRATFTILAVVAVPAVLLLGLEGALRLSGYGEPVGFLREETVDGERVHLRNPYFTRLFFRPELARECHPFSLPVEKPSNSVRVFLLGASAANGIPESAYGMGRMLEVLLQERMEGRDVEVVDVAITATNSHVTRRIARACAGLKPDLFVLYLGNNEVVGPYGPGTVFAPLREERWAIDADVAIRSTRLAQLAANVVDLMRPRAGGRTWKGLEMFQSRRVTASDPRLATVYRHFEANVRDIAGTAVRAEAPLLLCTVGVNLRDCAPFASVHGPAWTEAQRAPWQELVDAARRHEEEARFQEALAAYREAAAMDPEHAEIQWCLARAEEEPSRFARARDLDALRFRADTRIGEILREVAADFSGEGVHLVDTEAALAAAGRNGTPGREMFWEHVHLTFEGNLVVARNLAQKAMEVLGGPDAPEAPWPEGTSVARRLAYGPWDRARVTRSVLAMMARPPFPDQRSHAEEVVRLESMLPDGPLPADSLAVSEGLYEEAMHGPSPHWLLRFRHAAFRMDALGDAETAAAEWSRIVHRFPRFTAAQNRLADAWVRLGRLDDAQRSLETSLRIDPYQAAAHSNLGTVLMEKSREDPALLRQGIRSLERAVSLSDEPGLLHNLGRARTLEASSLAEQGREDEARTVLREVLRRDPDHEPARALLFRLEAGRAP